MSDDRALLVAFCEYASLGNHLDTPEEFVDAFLAARQPQVTPHSGQACRECQQTLAEQITPPAPRVTNADWAALEADAVRLAEAEKRRSERMAALGLEPPAPQRFWRVMRHPSGSWFCYAASSGGAMVSDGRIAPFRPTRAEAEADGRASGLPEWPGGKR